MADDLGMRRPEPTFLALTPSELEIATAARSVLEGLIPLDRLHAPDCADLGSPVRLELAELGWFGLIADEAHGGSAQTAVEFALFFREVGRVCGPVDILAQCLAVFAADNDDLRTALIEGRRSVSLGVRDGAALRILGAPDADLVLEADAVKASLIDRTALSADTRPTLDPGTTMQVAQNDKGARIALRRGSRVWELGQLATTAMLVGVAEAALDLIVEYAKVRETFGRKIGSYQAVRHPCADMALRVEAARCQLWYAAASLKEGRRDASTQLAAAKHVANQAAMLNADVNIQLHGGIGVTDEHHAHLFLKRAILLSQVFGSKRSLLAGLLHSTIED